jgi:hypothetical protein
MSNVTTIENPRLAWRINDFCKAVGICRASFYKAKKQGKIKTIEIAGRQLVPDAEAQRIRSGEAA